MGNYGYEVINKVDRTLIPKSERTTLREVYFDTKEQNRDYYYFGNDNLFPNQIAYLNRTAPNHNGILEKKVILTCGEGFNYKENYRELIEKINTKESLFQFAIKYFQSFFGFGNVYVEIVTNTNTNFVNLYVKDYTTARLGRLKNDGFVAFSNEWQNNYYTKNKKIEWLPLYPNFARINGNLHSIFYIKNEVAGFTPYGLPTWLAGLDAAEISRNIDMWNANRTANGFSASAIYEGEFDSDEDANLFTKMLKNRNSGADVAGDILVAKRAKGGSTKGNFIDLTNTKDGEFLNLKNLSTDDLISCHSFYRSLCSMPDNTGFDTDRILNEYNIFINTTAKYEQQKFIENINFILNSINPAFDLGEISFINKPPVIREKIYKIWELRKIEGLEYNENDPQQNEFYSDYKRNTK